MSALRPSLPVAVHLDVDPDLLDLERESGLVESVEDELRHLAGHVGEVLSIHRL